MIKDEKAKSIFKVMVTRGIIPENGMFDITEKMLESSFLIYRELFPPKTSRKLRPSDVRLNKKICGLNLMKLLEERTNETETINKVKKPLIKAGFVYVISNPAFQGKYKVGMTTNLENRLSVYQTYDPERRFKIENYAFVENRRLIEKSILDIYSIDLDKGEWVSTEKVKEIFSLL